MKELELFNHRYEVQIRFADFDILGHINNTKHLVFVENARIDYMETVAGQRLHDQEITSIIAHVDIDYIKPIFPGELVNIYTRCSRIGNKSYQLESITVTGSADAPEKQSIVAKSNTVIVSYDYKNEQAFPLPQDKVENLIRYEKAGSILISQK